MKFEEVLPALREGKKIRLKGWEEIEYIFKPKDETELRAEDYHPVNLSWKDLFSGNWEIIKEKKKIKLRYLTEKQFLKYCTSFTGERGCNKCAFYNVNCEIGYHKCWIDNKDLYSDKFLDQEVEIEEE